MTEHTQIIVIHDAEKRIARLKVDLHDLGYRGEVFISSSIEDALIALNDKPYHLLITGLHFEQADEITSALNRISQFHTSPVVFLVDKPNRFNHVALPLKVKYAFLPTDVEPLMLGQTIGLLLENHELTNYTRSSDRVSDTYEQQVSELLGLLEHHNDGIIIFDASKTVRYRNDTACNMFEGDFNEVIQASHKISQNLDPMGWIEFGEKGDHSFWLDIQCMPIIWNGEPVTITFIRDVTRQRQFEEEAYKARRMEGLSSLAGGIAHDFNNILMAIMGYSSMLSGGTENQSELLADIEAINHSVERASALTRKLLAFGRQSNQRTELHINEVILDLHQKIQATLGNEIQLEIEISEATDTIVADRAALEQVVMNITQNARDAMPEGGTFTISTHRVNISHEKNDVTQGEFIQIRISDTGPGIPTELLDRIFDPFFTTKARHEGAGLGLSTVYVHVQRMGGNITIRSEMGSGTTFHVNIPPGAGSESLPKPAPSSDPAEKNAQKLAGETRRILFVEDEHHIRKILTRKLTELGLEVLQAGNAAQAMQHISDEHVGVINLIITDIIMPDMNGVEMVKELRKRGVTAPVIYISGYDEMQIESLEPEASFLRKPFTIEALVKAINQVLK
jgi:signal transduction histidine kinase/DNA-binding response OmpR family regulator